MSRHHSASSYGQRIRRHGPGDYTLYWTVDFYYPTSNLRHPRTFRRPTDEAGAKRFAKRWGVTCPVPE